MSYYNWQGEPITFAEWLGGPDNRVAVALTHVGSVEVSTLFFGVDHRTYATGPPLIFETMVFGGALDGQGERYSTEAEALAGHDEWVAKVRGADHADCQRAVVSELPDGGTR